MPAPALSAVGERLYDALAPLAQRDEPDGWPLAIYANAYAAMLDQVAGLVSDTDDGTPGYVSFLFDPDHEPFEWLGVTEYFVGVTPLPSVDDAGRRLRIRETDGRFRGTPKAIKGAARQFLTGTKTVFLLQRAGAATTFNVTTLASETPDSAKVQAALDEQKPAGFTMVYTAIVGGDYLTLRAVHTDYADIKAQFATYLDVRTDPSIT